MECYIGFTCLEKKEFIVCTNILSNMNITCPVIVF